MEILVKKHDKDSEMLELFDISERHGRKLTTLWAVVHSDFIDDSWVNNLLSEGNTVKLSLKLEGLHDDNQKTI